VTLLEKHTLNGINSNTVAKLKHNHRYVTLVKSGAYTVATMFSTVA